MKALRILYYLLMPVFLVAGLYTGMRLWFILLLAQILLVLFIFALNQWTLRTFAYTQSLDVAEAVKGSETALHLSIRNEKPFPLSMMKVDVEMAAPSENTQVSFSLLPFTGKEFDFKVAMPYRGVYPIGITTMRITDIFGLLPMGFDMRKLKYYRQPELTVYPRAETPDSLYADMADEKLFGERYLHASESGSSISGARAYRPGDPLKQIHWKKSAQHGELFVKQYERLLPPRTRSAKLPPASPSTAWPGTAAPSCGPWGTPRASAGGRKPRTWRISRRSAGGWPCSPLRTRLPAPCLWRTAGAGAPSSSSPPPAAKPWKQASRRLRPFSAPSPWCWWGTAMPIRG